MGLALYRGKNLPENINKMAGEIMEQAQAFAPLSRVLILPPDITRFNSYAGPIVSALYALFSKEGVEVDVMPALGTHFAMDEAEMDNMYPGVPHQNFIVHRWREDIVKIGQVPASYVKEVSQGYMDTPIDIEINKLLLDPKYDLVLSVGQVVPHEIVGMANYSKNIFVGCGGSSMVGATHYLGAIYGMERMMGRDKNPVRAVLDYAQAQLDIPLLFVLTVTTQREDGSTQLEGLFCDTGRKGFEDAVALSQQENLVFLDAPLKKVVCYLDPEEFRTTWLGNKSVYRTRMAIADGGELIVIAPGVHQFGEDPENDKVIRRYGYFGKDAVAAAMEDEKNEDLRENLSVAAHLIHGSSDGRFKITYAPGFLTRQEVENAGFQYMDLESALEKYNVKSLRAGMNVVDGEEVFYVPNPAIGLWAYKQRFFEQEEL